MSIVQTYTALISEPGIYYNGVLSTAWVPHTFHRGPFGFATSKEVNSFIWKFTGIDGDSLHSISEEEAILLCAFGNA